MDNILLYSSKVFLSENEDNPDSYLAKFVICDFDYNRNNVGLNRDTIDTWLHTLKNKPLVGKIKVKPNGEEDFSGHNVKVVTKTDEEGNKYKDYEFLTDAFGTFVDVGLETIDDVECIVATAEIWKRFTRACEIIKRRADSGTLHTSWEVSVVDFTKKIVNGTAKKLINTGRFIGHCLLAKDVTPAYDSSGLLEIASMENDIELCEALSLDIHDNSSNENIGKEDNNLENENVVVDTTEQPVIEQPITDVSNVENDNNTDTTKVVSELTDYDIREKISKKYRELNDRWGWVSYHFPLTKTVWFHDGENDLDYTLYTYEVNENDEITLSEPQKVKLTVSVSEINQVLNEKNDAIIKASEEIQSLKSEVSELAQYKTKFETIEQERIQKEFSEKKEMLVNTYSQSGLITKEEFETSSEIKGLVESLDESGLKNILATRYLESLKDNKNGSIDVSSVNDNHSSNNKTPKNVVVANLSNEENESVDYRTVMKLYLGK